MGSQVRPTGIISLIQSLKPVCSSRTISVLHRLFFVECCFMPQTTIVAQIESDQTEP